MAAVPCAPQLSALPSTPGTCPGARSPGDDALSPASGPRPPHLPAEPRARVSPSLSLALPGDVTWSPPETRPRCRRPREACPPQRQTFICSVRLRARELPRSRRFPGTPRGAALTAESTGSHRRVPLGAGRRVAGLGGTRRAGRRRAGTKPRALGTPANSRGAHVRHRGKYKCQSSDRHRGPRGAVHAATGPPRAQSRSSRTGRAARCPRRPGGRRS